MASPLGELSLAKMQEYVNHRAKAKISPVTIRKEIATLRAAWNWGEPMELTDGKFPNRGLRYPKADEKPPFMTMAEIERQIAAGGDPDMLWEALYLQASELTELLAHVKEKATAPVDLPAVLLRRPHRGQAVGDSAGAGRGRGLHREHRAGAGEEADPRPADHPPRAADAVPQGSADGTGWRFTPADRPCSATPARSPAARSEAAPPATRTKRNARHP